MKVHVDKRSCEVPGDVDPRGDDALAAALRRQAPEMGLAELHAGLRPLQLRLARALHQVRERGRLAVCCAASVEELAGRFGFGREETRTLLLVGAALAAESRFGRGVEVRLLDGRLDLAAAAELGRAAEDPNLRADLLENRERWLQDALEQDIRTFRRAVSRRKCEASHRKPATTLTTTVTLDVEEDLERARTIASRKKQRALTTGETIGEAVDHYLDCFDPMRRTPRSTTRPTTRSDAPSNGQSNGQSSAPSDAGPDKSPKRAPRKSPDTSHDPNRRHIPEAVKRIVRRRANDCCEVPGCTNDVFLQFAHIHPHAAGGSRDPENILLLCTRHHFLLDANMLTFLGWGTSVADGWHAGGETLAPETPVFEDLFGQRLGGEVRGPPIAIGADPPWGNRPRGTVSQSLR